MTSAKHNRRKALAKAEQDLFDMLPSALRAAINSAPQSVRASVVYAALLKGVPEQAIIETLTKRTESK
jgi:hypothetical protein